MNATSVENQDRQSFTVLSFRELMDCDCKERDYILETKAVLPRAEVNITDVLFGDKVEPDFPCIQHPPGWHGQRLHVPEVKITTVKDALVHGESGIVTVGNVLLRESLKLPSYEHFDIRWIGSGMMSLPLKKIDLEISRGAHLFCGYPGTRNYSHFLLDIILSSLTPPLSNTYDKAMVLSSQLFKSYQLEYMKHFPELYERIIFLKDKSTVLCNQLLISTFSSSNQHHFPHPYHYDLACVLRDRMIKQNNINPERFPKKIYINRLDSKARKLLNEEEVVRCAQKYGFTSVSLSSLSVAEQAALFFNASHIIAPHGAGSTNILYGRSGVVFLELLFDNYVQWSMRRINSLVPVRYGCLIGKEVGEESATWKRSWTVDINKLEDAIKTMSAMD